MNRVDLHVHTTVSDGMLTPHQVVLEASKRGLSAIGITDHDTMQGLPYAEAAGRKYGVEVVPGVELSADYEGKEIHLAGYFCDPNNPVLRKTLKKIRLNRFERMVKMVEKLKQLGIPLELSDVLKNVKGNLLGRPHLALTLCEMGYCQNPAEAFKRYIGARGPAYVERMKFTPFDAIFLIRNARGIPVLAHPGLYGQDAMIPALVSAGLLGIEVFHPDHQLFTNLRYLKIARKYNLLVTGGSDFHGSNLGSSPHVGHISISQLYLEKLQNVSKAIRKGAKRF